MGWEINLSSFMCPLLCDQGSGDLVNFGVFGAFSNPGSKLVDQSAIGWKDRINFNSHDCGFGYLEAGCSL